jgi:hypothetical protein
LRCGSGTRTDAADYAKIAAAAWQAIGGLTSALPRLILVSSWERPRVENNCRSMGGVVSLEKMSYLSRVFQFAGEFPRGRAGSSNQFVGAYRFASAGQGQPSAVNRARFIHPIIHAEVITRSCRLRGWTRRSQPAARRDAERAMCGVGSCSRAPWLRAPVPHTAGDHTDAPVRACDLIASCIGKAPP